MASGSPELGRLERGLVKHADSALSSRGYFLSLPARDLLAQCVITGTQQMRVSGEPKSQDIEKAQVSVERLVEEISNQAKLSQQRMQDEARNKGLQYYDQITISTIDANLVSAAMTSLCPGFWPFC